MAKIIKANTELHERAETATLDLAELAEQARRIVLDARQEAVRIVAAARASADKTRSEAEKTGYAEGLARGGSESSANADCRIAEKAAEMASRQAAEVIELVREVARQLELSRHEILRQARHEVLELAMEIARHVVGRVSVTGMEPARQNLAKVLDLCCRRGQVTVLVNPSQYDDLLNCCGAASTDLAGVKLQGDPAISRGGVKLISPSGQIDATIESQLQNIVEALLGGPADVDAGEYVSDRALSQSPAAQPQEAT